MQDVKATVSALGLGLPLLVQLPRKDPSHDELLDRGADVINATSGYVISDDHSGGGLEPRRRGILVGPGRISGAGRAEALDAAVAAGHTNRGGPDTLPCGGPTGSRILQASGSVSNLAIEHFPAGKAPGPARKYRSARLGSTTA